MSKRQRYLFLPEVKLEKSHLISVYFLDRFKNIVKQRLREQYVQSWQSIVHDSGTCCNYRMFKTDFCFENYLIMLPKDLQKAFLTLRVFNNKLPENISRYNDVPRNQRICSLCDMNEIWVMIVIICSLVNLLIL